MRCEGDARERVAADRAQRPGVGNGTRPGRARFDPELTAAPPRPADAATTADVAQLHESLEQQNELLRALLSSSVDTQADARATAQNSRTFAWAGTAIALLTLIATVVSVVAVLQGA